MRIKWFSFNIEGEEVSLRPFLFEKLMKFYTLTFVALVVGFASLTHVSAQDSALGALPPIPNLDFGDPDTKLSRRERREKNKAIMDAQEQTRTYTRTGADTGSATFGQRVAKVVKNDPQKMKERSQEVTVRNSITSNDDALTASGSRLQPFGDDQFWGELPPPTPEESLIDLPPLPDLRTPDQITRKERMRDRRLAKFEAIKAENEAKREAKEMEQRATVNRPPADPNSALIQVESQSMAGSNYIGNQEAPETVNQGTLKPFDAGSSYYKGNDLVYKGRENEKPFELWWKRGTSEAGGGEADAPKSQWRNPFADANDRVQPVSYSTPDASGPYSGGSASLDATPLTSNLRGIRVVRSTREVTARASGISGVSSEGVDLPPKVYGVLAARVGGSLTLGGLNQMVREAIVAYRKSDFPVVDVLVPEQEITGGVLQLVIIEGRLGDVTVEGASRSEGRALASQIRTERGEVIRESELTEDLDWINKHPTRQVDLIFSPGEGYGETDVILRSQSFRELSGYVAYENSGNSALGESRALFGTSLTGPLFFGQDTILSYQFTTNFDNSDASIFGHSGVFASYLPWRHQVTLLGAYVDSESRIPTPGGLISVGGVNKQISGRYGIPLPSVGRISHELEFGMDFKSSNSALQFGNVQVFDTTSEIVQYSLGYNMIAKDQTGVWSLDSEVISSPGNNTDGNTDAIFATQRAGASANYTYGRVMLERDQRLPEGWSLYSRMQFQMANSNLLSSETLGAGGYDSVRGFEQRVVNGDRGVVGTVELRTPTVYPSVFSGFSNVRDGAYGLLFYDFGSLGYHQPTVGQQDATLGSVGLGLRYQRENWFTLRVDYGLQVTEDGFDDGNEGRWHVGARATF